jgi:membrane protease YdiL (CAAX protease family)
MTQGDARVWKKIAVYYVLTTALTAIFNAGDRVAPSNIIYVTGAMWSPAVAAFCTKMLFRESIRDLGWQWGTGRYQILGYLLPLAYAIPVYLVVWGTGLGGFYDGAFVAKVTRDYGWSGLAPGMAILAYVAISMTAGFIPKTSRALGEEIGWRGFLVPELAKVVSFPMVGLISGLLWAAWHVPSILFSTYNAGTPPWFAISCFTVMIVAQSFMFAWLRLRSGSLWPAALLHGSHNMFVQLIFTPLTANTGYTPYLIDEFGIGMALSSVVVALILCRKWPLKAA